MHPLLVIFAAKSATLFGQRSARGIGMNQRGRKSWNRMGESVFGLVSDPVGFGKCRGWVDV